jgi:hypothetical protein
MTSTLGDRSHVWGSNIVGRLQLEENSRLGDFALIGTGDPLRDPFHVYAHRFSVFVPAANYRSQSNRQMMRFFIDSEKPAHTSYTLCPVEARFRIGVQATVGFDTLIGAYPRLVLNYCATLGYDSVLSRSHEERGPSTLKVGERARVGLDTIL